MSSQNGIAIVVVIAIVLSGFVDARDVIVGGDKGWSFGMNGWPNGQTFNAGDVLVFNYNSAFHNVVIVSKENYDSCTPSGPTMNTGHDTVSLSSGTSYYICGIPAHCQGGMKAAVTAV